MSLQEKGREESLKQPLDLRAWTFQERILSSRVISYGPRTLKWSCASKEYHLDDSLCALTYQLAEYPSCIAQMMSRFISNPGNSRENSSDTINAPDWLLFVLQYSARKHSEPEDRLVALSGVVQMLASRKQSHYLAGLWRNNLIEELGWYRRRRGYRARPAKYRAPSWSWASIDGQVYHHGTDGADFIPVCDVVGCDVRPTNADAPFGAVKSGWLLVHAPVMHGYYHPGDDEIGEYDSEDESINGGTQVRVTWGDTGSHSPFKNQPNSTLLELIFDVKQEPRSTSADFLVLSKIIDEEEDYTDIIGLVLKEVLNGTYERIGWFKDGHHTADTCRRWDFPGKRLKII